MNKHAILMVMALLTSAVSLSLNATPATTTSVKKLMQLTGTGELGMKMMHQMLPSLQRMVPDAPDTFWQEIMSEINGDQLENMIIPIYQKYLTEEDIQTLNAFYQTPVGRKLIRAQPQIMQESMQVGNQWGQEIALQILHKYQKEKDEGLLQP